MMGTDAARHRACDANLRYDDAAPAEADIAPDLDKVIEGRARVMLCRSPYV